MIVHIAHKEHVPISLKSHTILGINIGLIDTFNPFHRVTSQSWIPKVRIK
ncbi:MAG: hypothetical protein HY669_03795 [Chloroflexi bacterium]|nr:hypothetical protein [Chloroflexota bacterium]